MSPCVERQCKHDILTNPADMFGCLKTVLQEPLPPTDEPMDLTP